VSNQGKSETMRNIIILALVFTFAGVVLHEHIQSLYAEDKAQVRMSQEEALKQFPLDSSPLNRSEAPRVTSYADVLDNAKTAVVTVASESVVRVMRNRGNPMEEFLRRFYGLPSPRGQPQEEEDVMERRVPNGLGSGVLVSSEGYILTNNHVVSDDRGNAADEITVTLADDREFSAVLIGRDPKTDVALLKIEGETFPSLKMADSNLLRVGDIVFAVGNPLGLEQTVTMGIVSATGRAQLGLLGNEGYENFIQTDASINMGNSGGALIDAEGRLVGINTAIVSPTGGNIGIGFAIPVNLARSIMLSLLEDGTVSRGFLGVGINDLDVNLAESFGLENLDGALIERVQEGTPADKAGLKRGDVITGVNGKKVEDVNKLRLLIAQEKPGSEVDLEIIRNGEKLDKTVTLGSLDDPDYGVAAESIFEGIVLEVPDPEQRERMNLDFEGGVMVAEVEPDSPYFRELTPGMVILEANDQTIFSIADLRDAIRQGPNRLWVYYRGNRGYLGIRVR